MTHSEDQDQPAQDAVLGRIPVGERDSALRPAVRETSHRKRARPAPPAHPADTLALPRGALVAMRVSGGLRFSSREMVAYRDGRVIHRRHATGATLYTSAPRLTGDQLAELSGLLQQATFPKAARLDQRQSPDALAYELVARVGRGLKTAEVFQGSLPEGLAPLIRWLGALIPRDE